MENELNEIDELKNEFYSILHLLRKELEEVKLEISLMKEKEINKETEKEMNEYNKLLSNYSNYIPLKDKPPKQTKVIEGVEYTIDNNVLFNDLGEIVGKLDEINEVVWIKN
jgi:hypothetical protein